MALVKISGRVIYYFLLVRLKNVNVLDIFMREDIPFMTRRWEEDERDGVELFTNSLTFVATSYICFSLFSITPQGQYVIDQIRELSDYVTNLF